MGVSWPLLQQLAVSSSATTSYCFAALMQFWRNDNRDPPGN